MAPTLVWHGRHRYPEEGWQAYSLQAWRVWTVVTSRRPCNFTPRQLRVLPARAPRRLGEERNGAMRSTRPAAPVPLYCYALLGARAVAAASASATRSVRLSR